MLGAVEGARKAGIDVSGVKVLVGTSAGSLVAALTALQVPTAKVLALVRERPLLSYLHLDFDGMMKGFGVDSGRGLEELIEAALGCNITFKELHERTAKKLVVVATAVTSKKAVYLSMDDHPDMSINVAIRMSCGVPVLYDCMRYGGDLYVDGGVTDHFAVSCAAVQGLVTLGVCIRYIDEPKIETFSQYVSALFGILTTGKQDEHPVRGHDELVVPVRGQFLDMQLNETAVVEMLALGEKTARELFSIPTCPPVV